MPIMNLFAIISVYKRDTWLANVEFAEHGIRSESDLSYFRMKGACQKDITWKSMFELQPPPDFVQQLTCMNDGSSMERLMNNSNAMRGDCRTSRVPYRPLDRQGCLTRVLEPPLNR